LPSKPNTEQPVSFVTYCRHYQEMLLQLSEGINEKCDMGYSHQVWPIAKYFSSEHSRGFPPLFLL